MKKNYFFFVLVVFMLFGSRQSFAQIVGTDVFLQGHWLEVGVDQMGAFGTCSSPATYHAHACCGSGTCTTSGAAMDASYDWGHDGWAAGTPCLMGPYTEPGYPQEGWSIEVAGTEYRNWAGGGLCSGSFSIPGSITGYSNTGATITGTFTGAIAGLNVIQETRVDTNASWVVITTKMYNTTLAPITGVYYERTCDPDNTSDWGGSSVTTNVIVHQNEDPAHDVEIGTYYNAGIFNQDNSWMGLATKDCRAKCGVLGSLFPSNLPSELWAGTGPVLTTYSDSNTADEGIFLVFNVGTIPLGDSAVVSYAYFYNGRTGGDSALPDPQLVVAGSPVPTALPPNPTIDTYNTCSNPLALLIPVSFNHATDKDWTWSTWTWAPSTGLTTTTGVNNTVNVLALTGPTTYTITGTDTSVGSMLNCNVRVFLLTIIPCHHSVNNSPCVGDTLRIWDYGDSLGASYSWTGPGLIPGSPLSRQQYITIFPATFADSGLYHVIKTVAGVSQVDSTVVVIRPKAVIGLTSNAPLCLGILDTLQLGVSPYTSGETFNWFGPNGFGSTLQNPTIPGFTALDSGVYRLIATTYYGCKDTGYIDIGAVRPPNPPRVTQNVYCQGDTFEPYTIDSIAPGGIVYWYPSGDTTATVVSTSIPGHTTVYFNQRVGSCPSAIDSISVWVKTTPIAPTVAGTTEYCQYIGPFMPLTVTPVPPATDTVSWYVVPSGGLPIYYFPGYPLPDINTVPAGGSYNYWVSQTDSGCESPRTPVSITIHPKPFPPIVTPTPICQYKTAGAEQAADDTLGTGATIAYHLWYGPGVTTGTTVPPIPGTSVAPDTTVYYVTETSIYNCVSDSAVDVQIVKAQPPAPGTGNSAYCQYATARPLNLQVDSMYGSRLHWYYNDTAVSGTPTPSTNTAPGVYTWYVSQVVNGCEGDSGAVNVRIVYEPEFSILASSGNVCQYDSITLSYYGPALPPAPGYMWTLPAGAVISGGHSIYDSSIVVQFDSANMSNYVHLHATDDSGFCYNDTTIRIHVIEHPQVAAYTKPEVCLGDTMQLALSYTNSNAYTFNWFIDSIPLSTSGAISLIASNSNSGGPYLVRWIVGGQHIIMITTSTIEGCGSMPAFDSVYVRQIPDASFSIAAIKSFGGKDSLFCIGDSVLFAAANPNYNYSYVWSPEQLFKNVNTPTIYGIMEAAVNTITLTVVDPYGCYATSSETIAPGSCCSVQFPNAFTPGTTLNAVFRPVPESGYHNFHEFVILNRWGQMVYNGGNSNAAWDGSYNGVPQDMGIYYYYIKFDCGGRTYEQKGDVTLIR